jgi:hydroxymethylglutaryl-CoA reductase
MSPRTYTQKKEQLERWVHLEQEDIQKTKVKYQEEWDKAVKMIEETQKNVMTMREQILTQ